MSGLVKRAGWDVVSLKTCCFWQYSHTKICNESTHYAERQCVRVGGNPLFCLMKDISWNQTKPTNKQKTPTKQAQWMCKCSNWECCAALFHSLTDSVKSPNFRHASLFLNNLWIHFSSKCLFPVCSKIRNYNIALNKMYTVLISLFIYFSERWYIMLKISLGFEEQGMKFLQRKVKRFK